MTKQSHVPMKQEAMEAPADRRRFLATSAALGAGALAGASLRSSRLSAPTHRRPDGGPTSADWDALRRKLSTHFVSRPGRSSYALAHQLFDPRFDRLHPAGIAYCGTAADVSACLAFVKKFKMRFRVRSGGHSYAGWSSLDNGLVIDVSRMSGFSVGNGTVTVGAGTDLIHLYQKLSEHGLAIPGGSCPTVGLAGLALGGGIGVLSRQYGLTCDSIESLQIVTADGVLRTCDSTQHSDLLWASMGGGGGNFGVATSFTLRTQHLSSLVLFGLRWPWSAASRVIGAWQSWAPNGPKELWANMHLSSAFDGGSPHIRVGGTWLGRLGAANRAIDTLISRVGSPPIERGAGTNSFLGAMLIEAGCPMYTVPQCNTKPSGLLPRVPQLAKSDFFSKKLSASGIKAAMRGIERAGSVSGPSGGSASIAFDALGGAVNRVSPTATAFVHRDALFDVQYLTDWNFPGSARGVANAHAWLRSAYGDLHPFANGQAYQNYIDPELKNWRQAYYAQNYSRLAMIKGKYDPDNLFNFPQSITA